MASFSADFLGETQKILSVLNPAHIEALAMELAGVRARGGRLFILGVGGSAGHASHAVNDFRKLCAFEAYTPHVQRLRTDGPNKRRRLGYHLFGMAEGFSLAPLDALLIFSVGGGNIEKNVSPNLARAVQLAKELGAAVFGIVGRDGGYVARKLPPLWW